MNFTLGLSLRLLEQVLDMSCHHITWLMVRSYSIKPAQIVFFEAEEDFSQVHTLRPILKF